MGTSSGESRGSSTRAAGMPDLPSRRAKSQRSARVQRLEPRASGTLATRGGMLAFGFACCAELGSGSVAAAPSSGTSRARPAVASRPPIPRRSRSQCGTAPRHGGAIERARVGRGEEAVGTVRPVNGRSWVRGSARRKPKRSGNLVHGSVLERPGTTFHVLEHTLGRKTNRHVSLLLLLTYPRGSTQPNE